MAPLLSVRDLEIAFVTEEGLAHAVRGISFDVGVGETLGIVGESGCGKSITVLSVMRLLPPSARILDGTIVLDEEDLVQSPARKLQRIRGRRIAMVFQDSMTSLNPVLPIGLQITESSRRHLGVSRREAETLAESLLVEVGVPEPSTRLKQYPHQLSGGLRQRVAVAIALASNPSILIADEPTTALDVTIQAQLLDLLRREQEERQMALILVTHDLGVIAGMADRVAVMYAGRIVEQGSTSDIFSDPRHPYTLALLRSVPRLSGALLERLPSIGGTPPPIGALPPGCPFRPRCLYAVERCEIDDPGLAPVSPDHEAACWVDVREAVR